MRLYIRSSQGSEWYPAEAGGVPPALLSEDSAFILRLADVPADIDLHALKLVIGGVTAQRHYLENTQSRRQVQWSWKPEFYSGRFRAMVMQDGPFNPLFEVDLEVDPHKQKLTRDAFRTMLEAIVLWSQSLWELSGAGTGVSGDEGGRTPPLAYLEYADQHLQAIARVVHDIARSPRSRFEPIYRDQRLDRCRYIDTASVRQIALQVARQASGQLPAAQVGHEVSGIPPELWPSHVVERQRQLSYDIRENRFIKTFLSLLYQALFHLQKRLQSRLRPNGTWDAALTERLERSFRTARRLLFQVDTLLRLPFLGEVQIAAQALQPSPALLKDLRFSQLYSLYRQFPRSSVQLGSELGDLTLEKTYDLYEKWCFFEVIETLSKLHGRPTGVSEGFFDEDDGPVLRMPEGASVQFDGGITVTWQRTFRSIGSSWDTSSGSRFQSYGVETRPDIVIELEGEGARPDEGCPGEGEPGGSRLIILDPKYRVSGSGVRQGLGDMHKYRDAIVGGVSVDGISDPEPVVGAFILCPDAAPDVARYFDSKYRERFGFGGVLLKPGEPGEGLAEVLARAEAQKEARRISDA